MANQEARESLKAILAFRGVSGEEAFEAEIANINSAIPEASLATMPEDIYERANAFVDKYYELKTAGGFKGSAPTPGAGAAVISAPSISTEMLRRGSVVLAKNAEGKKARASKTRISTLVFDKPVPSSYLTATTTVVPTCTPEKLALYESQLVDTVDNRKAFQTVKDAVTNKTALPIYINDKSRRVVGYKVSTPSADAGVANITDLILSQRRLIGFLLTELQGYIPTDPKTGLSARVALAKSNKNVAANTTATSVARVRVSGIATAKENPSLVDVATIPDTKKTKKGRLRINTVFEIIENKPAEPGAKAKQRTIRLGGEAAVPEFHPASAEYAEAELVRLPGQGLDASDMRKATEESSKIMAVLLSEAIENPLTTSISEFGVSKTISELAAEGIKETVPTIA